jgi:phosphatidylinositol glycan class T
LLAADDRDASQAAVSSRHEARPAQIDGSAPAVIEFHFNLPANSTLVLRLDFERDILSWTSYPPDAHRGFDLVSGILSQIDVDDSDQWSGLLEWSPVLYPSPSQRNPFYLAFTEQAVFILPTPDFSTRNLSHSHAHAHTRTPTPFSASFFSSSSSSSFAGMPYNVITITGTVFAFFFGSVVRTLLQRYSPLRKGKPIVSQRPLARLLRLLNQVIGRFF